MSNDGNHKGIAPGGAAVATLDPKLTREVYKTMTFILTAAKTLVDEPKDYGPFRLVDAVGRLAQVLVRTGYADDAVRAMAEEIEHEKYYGLKDETELLLFLDKLLEKAAENLASRPKA